MATDIRVLIIADDPLVRTGLSAFMTQHPDVEVVAHVPAHPELAADVDVYRPGALLWDLGQDPSAGLDRLAELSDGLPPIVALVPDSEHIRSARLSGAWGVLFRDASAPALAAALRSVAEGLLVYAADSEQIDGRPDTQPDLPPDSSPRASSTCSDSSPPDCPTKPSHGGSTSASTPSNFT